MNTTATAAEVFINMCAQIVEKTGRSVESVVDEMTAKMIAERPSLALKVLLTGPLA